MVLAVGTLVPWEPLRIAIVLPTALVGPGYAIQRLWLTSIGLRTIERAALSLLLSLSFWTLIALAVAAFGIRISASSVVGGAGVFLVVLSAAGLVTRRRGARGLSAPSARRLRSPVVLMAVPFVALPAVVLAAVAVAPGAHRAGFTEFRLAGRWSGISRVAVHDVHHPLSVDVVVVNRSAQTQRYRLGAGVTGGQRWQPREIRLAPKERWLGKVTGLVAGGSCPARIHIDLRPRSGDQLKLALWVTSVHARKKCGGS